MKKSHLLNTSVVLVVSALIFWWLSAGEQKPNNEPEGLAKPAQIEPEASPMTVAKKSTKKAKEEPEEEFNPYESEVIKAQLQQVADIYAENIKYPISSQPIYNPEDVREYKSFEQSEVDLPFPTDKDDENPIRIAAATDTYQYFQGDVIAIRVQISGAPKDTFVEVNGVMSGANGDIPITTNFSPSDETLTQFTASFDTKVAPANLLTQEMLLKLTVKIGDRDLFTTVAFRYSVASAQVIGLRPVRVEGPNLHIPLQLNVYQSGYYFISGVLEEAETGRPLVQLQAEARLRQGNGVIPLNAHIAALRRQGSEGPYVIRSIRTYRGAEIGESHDIPASSSQARFSVQGFPFSAYADEAYVDQQAQERLEFLREVGGAEAPARGEEPE